jgi:hypothetical protein
MLDITERAAAAVIQMESAARRFNPQARIRLGVQDAGVTFALAETPEAGDRELDCGGTVLLVAEGLDGVIDIGEHNAPIMIPASSA